MSIGRPVDLHRQRGFGIDSAIEDFASAIIIWRASLASTPTRAGSGSDVRHRASWSCPIWGSPKAGLADRLGSAATKGRQNLLCAYLAGALLLGLLGNALLGAWWLDPVVGLLIAAVAVKEGREAWRGEGCCVGDPPGGAAPEDDASCDDCRAPG